MKCPSYHSPTRHNHTVSTPNPWGRRIGSPGGGGGCQHPHWEAAGPEPRCSTELLGWKGVLSTAPHIRSWGSYTLQNFFTYLFNTILSKSLDGWKNGDLENLFKVTQVKLSAWAKNQTKASWALAWCSLHCNMLSVKGIGHIQGGQFPAPLHSTTSLFPGTATLFIRFLFLWQWLTCCIDSTNSPRKAVLFFSVFLVLGRGVQPFGGSAPYWKKSCLGPHIKYIVTYNHKNNLNVLSKLTILCWAAFTAVLGHVQPAGCRVDTPAGEMKFYF